ncbi:uncharacterized protein VTP21DRAFT_3861 [Calcarisporiella thermophila]|uniref:uncharacterized protein n=1 Tax=Calcarisporiella thermophila TaxID=911321 RepID=UPI00374457F7
MGLKYKTYLNGNRIYGCSQCRTHLSTNENIISKSFNGQHGRAFLFRTVVNVVEGDSVDREMLTGRHTVRDIFCVHCHSVLGWKYVRAFEENQRYKEGKFILEKELLVDVS